MPQSTLSLAQLVRLDPTLPQWIARQCVRPCTIAPPPTANLEALRREHTDRVLMIEEHALRLLEGTKRLRTMASALRVWWDIRQSMAKLMGRAVAEAMEGKSRGRILEAYRLSGSPAEKWPARVRGYAVPASEGSKLFRNAKFQSPSGGGGL